MSIGFGILFASIVISITLLYLNRQKNIKLPSNDIELTNLSYYRKFLLLFLLVVFVTVGMYFLYIWISSIPNKQDSYQGIKLGMTMNDVRYIKGQPDGLIKEKHFYVGRLVDTLVDITELDSTDSILNYPEWNYKNISINFDKPNGKVVAISCGNFFSPLAFMADEKLGCEPLSGVIVGTFEDSLKHRFGKPDIDEITEETKIVEFKKFNARFYLQKQKVFGLELKIPEWVEDSNLSVKMAKSSGKFDPSTAVEVKSADDFLNSKK